MAHHILPGSLEIDGTRVTAGVHVGEHEWDTKDLRYVTVDWALHQNIATLGELLSYAYDNSEGSLTKHDFKMKGAS